VTFFDRSGSPVPYHQWLAIYEPSYFLGGPTLGRYVNGGNQSSQRIENRIDALLSQSTLLAQADLTLSLPWKIGNIDHHASASSVQWKPPNFPTALIGGRWKNWNFQQSIPCLATNMATIVNQLVANPAFLLNLKLPGTGFGSTNKLAMQFFITHGSQPLYDSYAHKGALAIYQNPSTVPPRQRVAGYKPVQTWNDYQSFKSLLRSIGLQPHGVRFISRDDDRALWVYGHLFK
jgi:hypothetical protein